MFENLFAGGGEREGSVGGGQGYGERVMERVAWGSSGIIGLHYNSLTGARTDERI